MHLICVIRFQSTASIAGLVTSVYMDLIIIAGYTLIFLCNLNTKRVELIKVVKEMPGIMLEYIPKSCGLAKASGF